MPATLRREGDLLVLSLGGLEKAAFADALENVRRIPGRRWNPDTKDWEFAAAPLTAHKIIHTISPTPTPDVLEWVRESMLQRADDVVTQIRSASDTDLRYARARDLYQHQIDAVAFLRDHPRSIVADDMGLGKTIEAIAAVEEIVSAVDVLPTLVIAPSTMVGKWAEEIETWSEGAHVFPINSRAPPARRRAQLAAALATPGAWIVVNWEQVRAQKIAVGARNVWTMKEPLFASTQWAAVIADEAHRAKNRNAQQTRGLWQINAPIKLALTGTPILNSPDEIWPLLVWIRPEQYGAHSKTKTGYHAFFAEYVEYSEGHFGKIVTGVRNADALRFELADKLVRRTKGDVLDLPPKVRTTIPLEMGPKQAKMYAAAETAFFLEVELALAEDETGRIAAALAQGDVRSLSILIPNAAARIVRCQQVLESPALFGAEDDSIKLDAAVERIVDNPGRQFVVFTRFKMTTELLAERLGKRHLKVGRITGDVTPEDRTAAVVAFQAGDLDVMVCTIAAGGVGLTLTAADTAIFVSRDWTPGINEQAEDRLHRIGQESMVNVLILEGRSTIDDGRIGPKNSIKESIVASVIPQDHIPTAKEGVHAAV